MWIIYHTFSCQQPHAGAYVADVAVLKYLIGIYVLRSGILWIKINDTTSEIEISYSSGYHSWPISFKLSSSHMSS